MPPVRFEPTISAGERPQTYTLDRAATGTGSVPAIRKIKKKKNRKYRNFFLGHKLAPSFDEPKHGEF